MASSGSPNKAQIQKSCHLCEDNLKITWKCLDCNKLFCDRCAEIHKTVDRHRVFNFHNRQKVKSAKCKLHREFECFNFCLTCDQLVCPRCLVQSHCHHSIDESENVFLWKWTKLQDHQDKIKNDMLKFFDNEDKKLDRLQSLHKNYYDQEKQKIKVQDENLKVEITKYTNKLFGELEQYWQEISTEIQKKKSEIDEKIMELTRKLSVLDNIQGSDDMHTVCNVEEDLYNIINNTDVSFVTLPQETKHFQTGEITEETIEHLIGMLKTITLSDGSLVEFNVLKSFDTDLKKISSIKDGQNNTLWVKDAKASVLRNIYLTDQLVTLKETTIHEINDMTLTTSGDLILALLNDPCIKVLSDAWDMKTFYKFPSKLLVKPQVPLAFCVLANGKIVVGAVEKNGKQYTLSENSHRQLVILSEKREQEQVFEYNQDGSRLFTRPRRITSNNKGEIYVIDRVLLDMGRVLSLSQNGIVRWIYKGHANINSGKFNLFDPCSIVTTPQCNVIVCDNGNNTFHILSDEGQIKTFIKADDFDIHRPFGMEIDSNGQLLVSSDSFQNRKAKIFVLQFTGC